MKTLIWKHGDISDFIELETAPPYFTNGVSTLLIVYDDMIKIILSYFGGVGVADEIIGYQTIIYVRTRPELSQKGEKFLNKYPYFGVAEMIK